MTDFIPPVVDGDFFYQNSTLTVDVGGPLKRHARASPAEIEAYVSGKGVGGSGSKDQVAHWYEAQLVHYGLQRSKDKNTAKVRLLAVINDGEGGLVQPRDLAEKERAMKRESAALARKAGQGSSDGQGVGGKALPSKKGEKRKRSGEGPDEDDGSAAVAGSKAKKRNAGDANGGASDKTQNGGKTTVAAGKKKAVLATGTKDAVASSSIVKPLAKTKGESKKPPSTNKSKSSAAKSNTKPDDQEGTKVPASAKKASTLKRSDSATKPATKKQVKGEASEASAPTVMAASGSKASQTKTKASTTDEKPAHKKQRATSTPAKQSNKSKSKSKSEPKIEADPSVAPPSSSPPQEIKHEAANMLYPQNSDDDIEMQDADDDAYRFPRASPSNVTGIYSLFTPQLPASPKRFFLLYEPTTDTLWGEFKLPSATTILKVDHFTSHLQASDQYGSLIGDMAFGWRARYHPRRLKFGRGCFGRLELLGGPEKEIRATFTGLFEQVITIEGSVGQHTSRSLIRDSEWFEEEWESYLIEAFGE
ncbi:hypothetical protein K431DRAFT_283375 [Polychaeton citri CBS 116435]|uniref:Uncharacterized protein n=1 Tax=Polychaeton citri CBS 116435 TaxID=1314669 RepID=A0A9P4UQH7_9PEZI|nr:hypothetical protein K431DRAFT_283375 [Polychaeton citri CBS 116435]